MKMGLLFQKGGMWIGVHYSPYNQRWCINLLPCVTLWICRASGRTPSQCGSQSDYRPIVG
jgi:hypothetical protein